MRCLGGLGLAFELRRKCGQRASRLKCGVLNKIVHGAVDLVRARLDRHIHLRRSKSILRGVQTVLQLEFLDCVRGRDISRLREEEIRIGETVDDIADGGRTRSVDARRGELGVEALGRENAALDASIGGADTGCQRDQVGEISPGKGSAAICCSVITSPTVALPAWIICVSALTVTVSETAPTCSVKSCRSV